MSLKMNLYSCYGCSCVLFEERHISANIITEYGNFFVVPLHHCNEKAIKTRIRHIYCQCGYFLGDHLEDDLNLMKIESTSVKLVEYDVS